MLQEDWTNESVRLVTCCEITDVNGISVDKTCPLYCTIVSIVYGVVSSIYHHTYLHFLCQSYDQGDSQGVWLLCFSSEYELGKFESALAAKWKDHFQVRVRRRCRDVV